MAALLKNLSRLIRLTLTPTTRPLRLMWQVKLVVALGLRLAWALHTTPSLTIPKPISRIPKLRASRRSSSMLKVAERFTLWELGSRPQQAPRHSMASSLSIMAPTLPPLPLKISPLLSLSPSMSMSRTPLIRWRLSAASHSVAVTLQSAAQSHSMMSARSQLLNSPRPLSKIQI